MHDVLTVESELKKSVLTSLSSIELIISISLDIFLFGTMCLKDNAATLENIFLESDSFTLFFATKEGLKNQVCTFAVPTW